MIRRADAGELPILLEIRRVVFIEGQDVPEAEERDGKDKDALHFIAFEDDLPVGTARILLNDGIGKIGRVAVLSKYRRRGIGKRLMRVVLDELRVNKATEARLGAQTHALGFYEALGFSAYGPEFLDAGIPHRSMALIL